MKTSNDPRHIKRQKQIQLLFSQTFPHDEKPDQLIKPVMENLPTIDRKITQIAPEFPIEKINKVDLSILRLCVYEILIAQDAPQKVIIDEGVELAKEFGADSSPAFINGALGKLVKELSNQKQEASG